MYKSIFQTIAIVLLLGFVGCATIHKPFDYDHSVNFSEFKTFNWHADPNEKNEYDSTRNSFVEKRFKRFIEQELGSKGVTINTKNPDLLLNYYVTVREKEYTSLRYSGSFFHGSYHHGHKHRHHGYSYDCRFPYYPQKYIYDESTVVIDMIDPKNNELVWRGWTVDRAYGPTMPESIIAKTVQKILKNFPPF